MSLLLYGCGITFAQHPASRQYTVNDGLPSTEAYYVMQDSKGYVWICTDAGISRFDGYSFKNFSVENGLPDNTIFELQEDNSGLLWMRSLLGKIAYLKNDSIISVPTGLPENLAITSFCITKENEIGVGLMLDKGYVTAAPPYKKWQMHTVSNPYFIVDMGSGKQVFGLTAISSPGQKNPLVIIGKGYRDTVDWKLGYTSYDTYKCIRTGPHAYFIAMGSVLYYVENGRLAYQKEMNNHIIHLSVDKNGGLWIGTKNSGALYYPGKDPSRETGRHFFGDNNISCVFVDKEGAIWASSTNSGVHYIPNLEINLLDKAEGLPENDLIAIDRLTDTSMIIAGKSAWLLVVEGRGKLSQPVFVKDKNINTLLYVKPMNDNKILLSGGKTFILDLENGSKQELRYKEKFPLFTRHAYSDTDYIIGSSYSTMYRYDKLSGSIRFIPVKFRANCFAKGRGDTLWIGCADGLRFMLDTNIYVLGDKSPAFKQRIDDICIKDNTLYLATKGNGLFLRMGNRVEQITTAQGLKSNICRSVCVNKKGEIWVATNAGISRITREKKGFEIENIDFASGLPTYEIKQLYCLNDKVFAISSAGLITITSRPSSFEKYLAPVYITQRYLANRVISPERIFFEHGENYFAFEFVGLSYKKGKKQLYRYKLNGADNVYKFTGSTLVQYPALPPGEYLFEVTVVDEKMNTCGHTASYRFHIDKPLWKKTGFLVILTVLLILLIYFLLTGRIRNIQKREEEKAAFKTRIAETELIALRAQMNPHFIFNTLNSIQNYILRSEKHKAYDYLGLFSKLIRNVLENSKNDRISLRQESDTLDLYLLLESLRFSERFEYSITEEKGFDPNTIIIPTMLIQPYIENAILHGIMNKEEKGKISIHFSKEEGVIKCIIEDNGVGREKAAEFKSQDPAGHRSMGMQVTSERMDILSKTSGTRVKAEVEDMYRDNKPEGTRVTIYIPVLREN